MFKKLVVKIITVFYRVLVRYIESSEKRRNVIKTKTLSESFRAMDGKLFQKHGNMIKPM